MRVEEEVGSCHRVQMLVGHGGSVAAPATLTLVEVGASAVIEDAGDSIHGDGERSWSCVDDDDDTV